MSLVRQRNSRKNLSQCFGKKDQRDQRPGRSEGDLEVLLQFTRSSAKCQYFRVLFADPQCKDTRQVTVGINSKFQVRQHKISFKKQAIIVYICFALCGPSSLNHPQWLDCSRVKAGKQRGLHSLLSCLWVRATFLGSSQEFKRRGQVEAHCAPSPALLVSFPSHSIDLLPCERLQEWQPGCALLRECTQDNPIRR